MQEALNVLMYNWFPGKNNMRQSTKINYFANADPSVFLI